MDQHLSGSMSTQANDILVSVYARTDIGRKRSGNEDAFLIADLTSGNVGLGPEMITHPVVILLLALLICAETGYLLYKFGFGK